MKITAHVVTALPNPERREVVVLMGGHRIDLTVAEARALVQQVSLALPAAAGEPQDSTPAAPIDRAAIVAKVEDQVFSWARITDALGSAAGTPQRRQPPLRTVTGSDGDGA
jgi:hypothetical protein